jgi:predicted PurR-regulated permease PerM
MASTLPAWDLTRTLLAVLSIGGLIAASYWVLRPFLPALVWAATIVVATWPTMRAVEARLWGRRGLAVAVMTLAMVVVVAAPITIAIATIAGYADQVIVLARSVAAGGLPAPPAWVESIPLVGHRIAEEWLRIVAARPEDLAAQSIPYLRAALTWLIGQAGDLGVLLLHLLLTVALSAGLYARGDGIAAWVLAFARRLAGAEGERVALLSAQAVRAVALGIVVTAVVQAVIGGVGLAVTGVPYAGLLAAVMLLLGVAQVGPWPVVFGATAWLYWKGDVLWGTVMLVWSIATTSFDNILRPLLIRRGADLPLPLIFAGVLGGLLAFGVIGLFIGPVILAVTYTMLRVWVDELGLAGPAEPPPAGSPDPAPRRP